LTVSVNLVGFTDGRVIVHTDDGGGSWAGSDVDGGPTRFLGPAPETGYGPLGSALRLIDWWVWALDENGDVVTSDIQTTARPACAA
jgi:hypothetical protein